MNHLPLLPVLIPLFAAALALFFEHRRFGMLPQRIVAWTSLAAMLAVACLLAREADSGRIAVYLLGDWPSRLGIVLMVDRLSALMLLVGLLLAVACLLHACAGWDRRAPHFHAFFQFQMMGLNGAFLTGDVFNLFVFFEVLLIASYGLLLSGGRGDRLRAGLHYVAFNIAASTLFLIALGLLYGLLGTLNLAELAVRVAEAPAQDQALVQAAAGLLLVVFCAKAALLPMYLWLPETYTHAPAAVAALFAVMTKVGLYAVLRVGTLSFGAAGPLDGFAWPALLLLGAATLALASLGVLAVQRLRALAAYLVLASAATLFVAFALARPGTVAAGLYYLAHSTFAGAALFLLADLIRRRRGRADDHKDRIAALPNRAVPGVLFLLVAVSLAGLPPLSGFIGKLMLLEAVPAGPRTFWIWLLVLGSSFMMLVGLARAGTRLFWRVEPWPDATPERLAEYTPADALAPAPSRPLETAATMLLVGYGIAMALAAAPLLDYTRAAAAQLQAPGDYVQQVRGTVPVRREP
ncbi:monovalent cation/H+ antiporter subunit D [Pseudoxanthomonas broegbernensis]|uniref:Monovalent cation/H+ antiporter subunit D n=1 Tax=Pseudoxanthomonas broegbernensis TaxID=83619 RepID=A0A7V8GMX1_9GAMM|nr:monovalent cation/H+ antiporter subunit D [Pseudoxanthomonas broegbernensis]KAF1686678.1 monovalent cation/H+ antiporter subunit D [Pseudoxanthomonas broegbernensis]MBB6063562.1 multicomponent K+:H+ antiporter subunit D [Pseudoxanthomonas broegbernensis]